MKLFRTLSLLLLIAHLVSCTSPRKARINYVQEGDSSIHRTVSFPEIKIQKNDMLSIQVYSTSIDQNTDAPFNLPGSAGGGGTSGTATATSGSSGFLVDENGNIEYPRFGTLHAEGLTKNQLADSIKKRLTEPVKLLDNPSVVIRFLNFKVTVLGEVAKPGSISIPTGHVTILEAIGLAGDIPLTGKKTTVRILRENAGQREIGYLDLTSKEIFVSPYYNLLQNDIVMVEPTKVKIRQGDTQTLQRVTTILGIISSLTLLYTVITR